jgi:hypothetical protein
MSDIHAGGCLCGAVRYRTSGAPFQTSTCHCTFCQRRTGSAFSEPVYFSDEQIAFSGSPRTTYEHRSDESGRWIRTEFCPRCGTTVSWTSERRPGARGIAGGTFDDPNWIKIERHIWTRSVQRCVVLPADVERFEQGVTA